MSEKATITWVAYCTKCGELEAWANGDMIEAVAKEHAEETGHKVLVGYYIGGDDESPD